MSNREIAIDLIRKMPEDASLQQIALEIEVAAQVRGEITAELERRAWLSLSEQSLRRAWDNADDDVFNELLSK